MAALLRRSVIIDVGRPRGRWLGWLSGMLACIRRLFGVTVYSVMVSVGAVWKGNSILLHYSIFHCCLPVFVLHVLGHAASGNKCMFNDIWCVESYRKYCQSQISLVLFINCTHFLWHLFRNVHVWWSEAASLAYLTKLWPSFQTG